MRSVRGGFRRPLGLSKADAHDTIVVTALPGLGLTGVRQNTGLNSVPPYSLNIAGKPKSVRLVFLVLGKPKKPVLLASANS